MQISEFGQAWCQKIIDCLVMHGCSHFFIAPGSRSSPLISAVISNPQALTFWGVDERSLGYMALGFSKTSGKTCAVVVTSGTALSNLTPAVCEAFNSEVPLLILSADRPFELHDCGANQTMKQADFFNGHINKSLDLPAPDAQVPLVKILGAVSNAIKQSTFPMKGPVHINVQLRDGEQQGGDGIAREFLFSPSMSLDDLSSKLVGLIAHKSGLIAVGELLPSTAQSEILRLSEALNWPIFADITSNLRLKKHPHILHHFEASLSNPEFVQNLDFEVVLSFGGRLVSKRYWNMLHRLPQAQFFRLSDSPKRLDQSGLFEEITVADLPSCIRKVSHSPHLKSSNQGFSALSSFDNYIKNIVKASVEIPDSERYFATRMLAQISRAANVFVSSSMPIRYLDMFAQDCEQDVDIFVNRGLSGIDGVISSALGMACADSKPSLLLIGDLAFLHDTNGLMLLSSSPNPLLIVVLNNSGGGIFHLMPYACNKKLLSPYLDTPHQANLSFLCKAHNIPHVLITKADHFDGALKDFFQAPKSMVIEVVTCKEKSAISHKEIVKKISSYQGHFV